VRNPLYDTDFCLILGAALLTRNWTLLLLAALYLAQLALQLPLEERELEERFDAPAAANAIWYHPSSRDTGP
jgi:protein-S-isoprenylcysteine O-methyltransferase Ste14